MNQDTPAPAAPTAPAAPLRKLRFHVLRHDPRNPESVPHFQTFEIEEAAGMTLFIALNEIREQLDASLSFDFVCRAGICGSCAMVVNGRPKLACRTLTQDLPADISIGMFASCASSRLSLRTNAASPEYARRRS